MSTDLAKELPKQIVFNYAPLKEELTGKLAYYNALVVTEESVKRAKKDRASLNDLKKSLNDKKISVKKDFLIPYDEFEREVKELMAMIDQPISAIDAQIKKFDEMKKGKKRKQAEDLYAELIGELAPLLPLEKIFNPKWLNVATTAKSVKSELSETILKVNADIEIIKGMHIECEQTMLDTYLRTLNMSTALAEKTRYEAQQAALKEYEQRKLEAEQKAAQEPVEPIAETCHPNETPAEPEIIEPAPIPDYFGAIHDTRPIPQEEIKDVRLVFYATTAAFRAEMKALTEKYGISYSGIEDDQFTV